MDKAEQPAELLPVLRAHCAAQHCGKCSSQALHLSAGGATPSGKSTASFNQSCFIEWMQRGRPAMK